MSELVPAGGSQPVPTADRVALADDAPSIEQLFLFAREAELRVSTLRMQIAERSMTAKGEEIVYHELQLKHPDHARVTSKRSDDPLASDYDIWLSDGERIRTYRASDRIASDRAIGTHVAGVEQADLPPYARQRVPLTSLPSGSIVEAFVHPHGLFRNVLVTGPLEVAGSQMVADREAVVVRARHPRAAKVLVDRPDRSIDVGIARDSGFVVLLTERVGDAVTHHAEVTLLDIDATIQDSAFQLNLPADTRKLY
jgi:hypothetical protein